MSNTLPRFGITLSAKQGREMLRKGAAMEADGCYMVVVALTEIARSKRYLDACCGSIFAFGHRFAGLSRSDVYAKLACGRALSQLHKVDQDFRRGLLCWTKVRAICRVATPETEDQWLDKAHTLSSSQLEHEVAAEREPITPRGKVPLKAIKHRIYVKLQDAMALARTRADNPHLSDEDCLEAALDFFLNTDLPTDPTRVTYVTPPETSQARWQRARAQLAAHPHTHDDDYRVAPGWVARGPLRSGQGDFHHPAPPLTWLMATVPRSARGSEVWAEESAQGAPRTSPT